MRKRWWLAITCSIAVSQMLCGQSAALEKFLTNGGISPVVLNDPGRFSSSSRQTIGWSAADAALRAGERTEKIKLLFPGASTPQEVTVRIRHGLVFLADDMALFTEEEFELKKQEKGSYILYPYARWTNGKIPFVIPIGHSKYAEILSAIAHINDRTNICMIPRTSESEYVEFVELDTGFCFSFVGRTGGRQIININDCGRGEIIHEICHTAGLYHEHTRSDRDFYVNIYPENIIPGAEINFTRIDETAPDIGAYDYGSIMHYGTHTFSSNGLPTMEVRTPPGTLSTEIGQLDSLSLGDIVSINLMYPVKTCIPNPNDPFISLSEPVTISPNPIEIGTFFTVSANVENLGSGIFKGCYYAAVFDSTHQLVRMLTPIQENDGLLPGSTYLSNLLFQGGTLYNAPGQYYIGMFYRDTCVGTFKTMGSDTYSNFVPVTLVAAVPLTLTVTPETLNFANPGGSQAFTIASNTTWTVSNTASWITINTTSGLNNGTILVTCPPNTNAYARTATILVQGGSGVGSRLITVTQEGSKAPLAVSPTTINVGAPSGTTSIVVEATIDWTVHENTSWISVSPGAGQNDGVVTIFFQQNTSFSPRSAFINVVGSTGGSKTIVVIQAAGVPTLSVAPDSLRFTADGGNANVAVTANVPWTLTESLTWISTNITSGSNSSSIIFTCQANPTNVPRSGIVTIAGLGTSTTSLLVQQTGAEVFVSVLPNILDFASDGGAQSFSVFSALTWIASTTADWLYIDPTLGSADGEVQVICEPNFNATARTGTITVTATGGYAITITVRQAAAAPTLDISTELLAFTGEGGDMTFELASNTTWRITEAVTWLSVTPVSGRGDATVTVVCQPRTGSFTRSAYLTVYATGLPSKRVTITQTGNSVSLSVSPIALSIGAEAGTGSFLISSNTSWTISEAVDWLSVTPLAGSNNGSVLVTYQANTSDTPRSATITVAGTGAASKTINIDQDGGNLTLAVAPVALSFTADAGNATFAITSNTTWNISESLSWLSVNTTAGNGNATITVSCTANATTTSRTGAITISGTGVTAQVLNVTQNGMGITLTVSPATLSVVSTGGNNTVAITSNTTWNITETLDWLSVSLVSGSNNGTVTVTCLENTTTSPRSGTITISGLGATSKTVTVTQSGSSPALLVTPVTLDFAAAGASSDCAIASNVNWTVTETLSWIQVAPSAGSNDGTVTVTCAPNTATTPRNGTITVSASGLSPQTITVNQAGIGSGPPASWNVAETDNNHTVILSDALVSNFGGSTLQIGDYVGVFYTVSGQVYCAGNSVWTGSVSSFPVYGDNASTPAKDGLSHGENFLVKVWSTGLAQERTVTATYAPVGTNDLITAVGQYVVDGISMITALNTAGMENLPIPLAAGWNMVSSYLIPQPSLLDSLLKPYASTIRTVENGALNTFTFSPAVNTIGSWNVTEGYRVETLVADTLEVSGVPVDPEAMPIPFQVGWQIIPYFGRTQQLIVQAMLPIRTSIDLIKDNTGKVYIPSLGINSIGRLKPTQGYQLKAKAAGSLTYPAAYMAKSGAEGYQEEVPSQIFQLPVQSITNANATLVFIADGLQGVLEPGDEIGVFSSAEVLVGSGVFEGKNMAVAIWGDDLTKAGRQGLLPGEAFTVRIWKKQTGDVHPFEPELERERAAYRTDDLILVTGGQLHAEARSGVLEDADIQVFPNPTSNEVTVFTTSTMTGVVHLRLLDMSGRVVVQRRLPNGFIPGTQETLYLSDYPEGVYLVQVVSDTQWWTGKVTVVR